jgi:hydrogenase maturation protease
MKPVVAALGSRLGRDDAVGLHLLASMVKARETEDSLAFTPLFWEDLDALSLAHELLTLQTPLLLIDCADMGLPGGSTRTLGEEHLRQVTGSVSTHGFGFYEALTLARSLGFDQSLTLFAIQPFDLSPLSGFTPEMHQQLPRITLECVSALQQFLASSP